MKKQKIVVFLITAILLFQGYNVTKYLIGLGKHYLTIPGVYLPLGIYLFAIGGLVQYLITGMRSSILLRLWLYFVFFSSLVEILIISLYYALPHNPEFGNTGPTSYPVALLRNFLWGLPVLIVMGYCYYFLSRQRTAVLTMEPASEPGKEPGYVFHPADKPLRLAIRLIDLLFVFLVLWSWENAFQLLMGRTRISWITKLTTPAEIKVVLGVGLFLYYLLMETITRISFGKIATDTIIVNESGEEPGIGQLVKRGFARLLSLGGWSALFRVRGWHDKLSRTFVTRGKYQEEELKDHEALGSA